MAAPAVESLPEWKVGVGVAPDHLDLREVVQPVLFFAINDSGISTFFQQLASHDPPVQTVAQVKQMWYEDIQKYAKGVISKGTLRAFTKLLDPAGFEWKVLKEPFPKRKPGNLTGNNKPRCTLDEHLKLEGVEPLNAATFWWSDDVFVGVPRKGEAASLNAYVSTLFDNTWFAMSKVSAPPPAPPPTLLMRNLCCAADPSAARVPASGVDPRGDARAVGGNPPTLRSRAGQERQPHRPDGSL